MVENSETGDVPVFSRPFNAHRVGGSPVELTLDATRQELAALAGFWNVDSVEKLSAELRLAVWRREGVRIKGTASAAITQSCVVTLEPIETTIVEEIDATFLPEGSKQFRRRLNEEGELIVDPDGPDEPETFTGGEIDLGALVTETIALGIDPYPRKADVSLSEQVADYQADDSEGDDRPSPFAALKDWKAQS